MEQTPSGADENSEERERQIAHTKIDMILQEVYMMGANDYEIPALMKLKEQVLAGEIDPQEAVGQAQAIKDNKQDYH
jgi:hypothetical protein